MLEGAPLMNVSRMTRRLAVSGVATAIAAGALVGASSTAANAATVDEHLQLQRCSAHPLGADHGDVDVPMLPADRPGRAGRPGGPPRHRRSALTIPPPRGPLLGQLGVTGASPSDDFALRDSATMASVMAAPLTRAPSLTPNDRRLGHRWPPPAPTSAFTSLPKAGTYDITLPTAFTFTPPMQRLRTDCASSPAPHGRRPPTLASDRTWSSRTRHDGRGRPSSRSARARAAKSSRSR